MVRILKKQDWYLNLIVFIPVLSLYLWSMPGTVVLEDDGLFILAGWFNGVAHPPGYPLYTLLAHFATHLPGSMTVAGKAHALSALLGALACCCVCMVTLELLDNRLAAVVAGVGYGVSEVFWSQAIIAEVYTLNSLLFFLAVWLCLRFQEQQGKYSLPVLYTVAFICGLGLSNHWPLFILSSPLLLGILWPWHWVTIRTVIVSLLFLIMGLSPYLWMVIRSQMNPAISFYGPIDTLQEFWFVISRAGYAGIDDSATAGWADKVQFAAFFIRQFVLQFGFAGFVCVLLGFISQLRFWRLPVAVGMLAAFLGNSVVLILMLGFDYDHMKQMIFRVFPHIAYGIAAIWLAAGFLVAGRYIEIRLSARKITVPALIVLILGTGVLTNLPLNYRASDNWTDKYARAVLDNLEQDAIIFTYGEVTTAPLAYLNLIERYRPDVDVYNGQGLVLSNRLYSFGEPEETIKQKNDLFISQTDRPIYYMGDFANSYANIYYGLFLEVNKDIRENNTVYRKTPEIFNDLLMLIENAPRDPWQNYAHRLVTVDYCALSMQLMLDAAGGYPFEYEWIDPRCRTYEGQLKIMEIVSEQKQPDMQLLKALLEGTESLIVDTMDKNIHALVEYYRGIYLQGSGEASAAVLAYRRAVNIWPDEKNPAHKKCAELAC